MKIFELAKDKRSAVVKHNKDFESLYNKMQLECSEAFAALKEGIPVYKGMWNDNDILLTDPTLTKRKSQNTANFYTLLMDNLPTWSAYPKRSESLICTTSSSSAEDYGDAVFLVLPLNGAKFGVCSKFDLWDSFNLRDGWNMNDFNDTIGKAGIKSDKNYKRFLSQCFDRRVELAPGLNNIFNNKPELFDMQYAKTPIEIEATLNKYLSPQYNKFKLLPISKLNVNNQEVWTDSKSYLINMRSDFYMFLFTKKVVSFKF